MDEIEKLHYLEQIYCEKEDAIRAAEITKQIAIKFLHYFHRTAELSFHSTGHNQGKPHPEVYQEFLKDYKNLNYE